MDTITKVVELYECNELDKAFELLSNLVKQNPDNENLHLWIGKIYYKKGEWGAAINAFNKVLEINPDNQEAKTNEELASSILSFFNPDMFNP